MERTVIERGATWTFHRGHCTATTGSKKGKFNLERQGKILSHWTPIKTQVKCLDAVGAACAELGLKLRIAKPGMKESARGYNRSICFGDAVIECPGPYDVALQREPDGTFKMVTDWHRGHVEKCVGKNFERLVQLYGVHRATAIARAKGLSVRRQAGLNGAINLVMTGASL